MYFHYQDLNDSHPKRYWLNGRLWLGHEFLHAEWCLPSWGSLDFQIGLNHYGDTAIGISFGLWLFWIHLSIENRRLYRFLEPITKRKDQKYTNGRTIGLRFFDRALWIDLWNDPMEHRRVDPKWWQFVIKFDDLIFGKAKYSVDVLEEGKAEIQMPEGVYPATYTVSRRTWKRPRWFAHAATDIWFDIPAGIPHEGKGENSWDIGMDGTFGIGTHWDGNVYQAAKRIALRCMEQRSRYGNINDPAYSKWRLERIAVV